MNHEPATAALAAAAIGVLSVTSAVGGWMLAAEIPAAVIATVILFLGGVLVAVLGWMAVTLYGINGTTTSTNEKVTNTVADIAEIKGRLDLLEHPERRRLADRVEALEQA